MTTAREFLTEAKSHLGYHEVGENYTKFGEWYGANPAPWCDMFVSYCAHKAKATDVVGKFSAVIDHAKWFASNGRFGHTPRVGAIVFFDWTQRHQMDLIGHAGIVEAVRSDGWIQTIEGNTGDAVMRRVRNPAYIVGYGYPKYDKPVNQPSRLPRTVAFGANGPAVRRLQRHLKLRVDGSFGPKTLAGVREYQKDQHLKVDGVVGPRTWVRLLANP